MVTEKFNYEIEQKPLQPKKKEIDKRRRNREYRERQLQIKRKKSIKLKNTALLFALLIFVLGGVTLARDNMIYKEQQTISNLKENAKLLTAENEDLNIKLLETSSLEKIEKIAKEKLGMIFPTKENAININ